MSEKKQCFPFSEEGRGGCLAVKELGCEGGGCGSRYADIICIFCTRNETIYHL